MQIAQWLAHGDNVSLFDDQGLKDHLARCPDPDHPEAKQLAGWLALRARTPVMSKARANYLRFWSLRSLVTSVAQKYRAAFALITRNWPVIWMRFWDTIMVITGLYLAYLVGDSQGLW